MKLGRSKIYFYDHLALWADNVADFVSKPFIRLSRWATERYIEENRRG